LFRVSYFSFNYRKTVVVLSVTCSITLDYSAASSRIILYRSSVAEGYPAGKTFRFRSR